MAEVQRTLFLYPEVDVEMIIMYYVILLLCIQLCVLVSAIIKDEERLSLYSHHLCTADV